MENTTDFEAIKKELDGYLFQAKQQIDESSKTLNAVSLKTVEYETKFKNLSEIVQRLEKIESETKSKYLTLENYFNDFEKGTEDKKSLKQNILDIMAEITKNNNDIISLKIVITQYHDALLVNHEKQLSLKTQISNLISNCDKSYSEIQKNYQDIVLYFNELFTGSKDKISIKNQIQSFLDSHDKIVKENESKLNHLSSFYEKVFTDTKTKEGKVILSLKSTLDQLEARFRNFITESENKLQALTDSSLHNAFATRAKSYTDDFKKMEKYSLWCILGIIIDIMGFGIFQTINIVKYGNNFNYNILIYQFSICFALIYALWMYNRNQKIAKKLAEEYHHKAALAEAMTGYRKLYDLSHEDPEYIKLFDSIKDQLNINPSMKIDAFLHLKSPQEEITSGIAELTKVEKVIELIKKG